MQKADRALVSARQNVELGNGEVVANRAYYACFYVAQAALVGVGEEPKTHSGTHRRFGALFGWLGELWKRTGPERVFVVDSCPVPCCDNARIKRSRLYPLHETGGAFWGYTSSKRRFFYGLKVTRSSTSTDSQSRPTSRRARAATTPS